MSARETVLSSPTSPAARGLTPWERRGIVLLFAAVVLFGGLVEFRSAFLHRRMGDLDVFLRAAWAVRAGQDIYTVTDDKGFHYHYPPLFAILLTPLADPPAGANRAWTVPYAVAVALWYALSVLWLAVAIHRLTSALEKTAGRPEVCGSRRWWALRVVPLLACLPAVGGSLMRGQVDLLLLLLLCSMMAAALRGRGAEAGVWLAGAITLKVIPAFLLLYPLWRRDGRWLVGCAGGLVVFLALIPAAVFGPRQTVAYYREWQEVLLQPALTDGGDQTRANELTNVTATDSQSFLAVLHNTRYLDRASRPPTAAGWVRLAHWCLGGMLTLLLLIAAGTRRHGAAEVVLLGNLIILMALLSPVCHLHYFALLVPAAMGLVAVAWERRGVSPPVPPPLVSIRLRLLFFLVIVANILPRIPGLELLRDAGLAAYAALLLWGAGCAVLWKTRAQGWQPLGLEKRIFSRMPLTRTSQASGSRAR